MGSMAGLVPVAYGFKVGLRWAWFQWLMGSMAGLVPVAYGFKVGLVPVAYGFKVGLVPVAYGFNMLSNRNYYLILHKVFIS
jgi:hypothetical protein